MTMVQSQPSPTLKSGRIKDARGRKVTQLDPIALYLLRRHDVINADTLRAIAHEEGVRLTKRERASLIFGVGIVVLVVGLMIQSLIAGDFRSAPFARTSSLLMFCGFSWMYWVRAKRARFNSIAAAMLKYARCPHCGYDLRLLPVDSADGATVCPECGCAWKLNGAAQ